MILLRRRWGDCLRPPEKNTRQLGKYGKGALFTPERNPGERCAIAVANCNRQIWSKKKQQPQRPAPALGKPKGSVPPRNSRNASVSHKDHSRRMMARSNPAAHLVGRTLPPPGDFKWLGTVCQQNMKPQPRELEIIARVLTEKF